MNGEKMSEEKVEEKIPTLKDFPVEWQIIIRATQSLISKAKDGADINMLKTQVNFVFDTKMTTLEVAYNKNRSTLEIMWKKYRIFNDFDEREVIFIKMYEKKMNEEEALELISTWYERILYHIENRSSTEKIYRDFYQLFDVIEWRKEKAEQRAKQ